ncbi:MAG: ATP-binding protein, partial [Bacteroidales bacterium]
ELKSKILELKDYISWVKSHPCQYAYKHLNNRIAETELLLSNYSNAQNFYKGVFPVDLIDSLNKLNNKSILKITIFNTNNNILYHEQPANSGEKPFSYEKLSAIFLQADCSAADSLIRKSFQNNNINTDYLFVKNSDLKGVKIGISFPPGQKTRILKELVLDSLSKIKYSNNEYVIINTFDGFALLSKGILQTPPLYIKESKDTSWQKIFAKELEYAHNSEGGFYTYSWSNKVDDEKTEKTSYFSGITDWEWIIGTGFFYNDIVPVIDQMNADLWNEILFNLIRFFIFLLILSGLAYLTMRVFAKKAKSNILLFQHFFKRAAQGMQIIDSSQLTFTEFDTLAQAANQMIYERERIRSVLSAEKSRLRYMIEAIPDLIFFKDSDSKFLGCNKAFEKYINKKSEEILGLSEYDLFGETEASGYVHSDKQIIDSAEPIRTTNWVEYPDGQRCLYYTLKTPYFDSENHLLGIIGISRDITEMEETRQRLILAKDKAEESDKLKTAFLANMSHEIRTPMNAIIGFSDLLGEDDLTQEEKVDFISKIKSAGRSLMVLINDIIDIAKIEAGQLVISESVCDLNQLLTDLHGTFEELKNASGKHGIELNLVVPDTSKKMMILTDPMRLQQILTNLLGNALKFTEFGSIEFGYTVQQDWLSFYVNDTGIGILPGKQKLLFQRFSQVDPSTTRKYGGTGLGLAISKNLTELLGGSIGMDSNPGKGSNFYFTLPFKPVIKVAGKIANVDLNTADWKGKTILVAEDIIQNYQLMEALLKRTGVRLLHAPNGQIAIDMVKSEPAIDLVLMDIQLPIKTGYEALREICVFKSDLPVISYTAFALPHERDKSLKAGFADFITKPIKTETLIPMLDKYLRNQGE